MLRHQKQAGLALTLLVFGSLAVLLQWAAPRDAVCSS
jgi:hypothetical protein